MKKLIKIIPFAIAYIVCLNSVALAQDPIIPNDKIQYPNGVAAVVDNRIITMDDLQRKLAPFVRQLQRECSSASQFQEKLTPLAQEVLDRMVDDILLINSFTSDKKLKIPESFLENHYAKFIIEHFQGNRSEYLEFLKAEGKTDREIREQQKEEVMIGYLRGKMRRSETTISPTQIQKYYEENKTQFHQTEAIHLRQIVLKNSNNIIEGETLSQKTKEIMAQLKNNKPFAEIAKEFSEDEMKKSGGDWGWINRSDIRQELADVAFALNKNQFSDPIILNNHTFILFVEDKKTAGLIPLSEISDTIEKTLASDYAKEAEAKCVQKLRKKAYIKYYL